VIASASEEILSEISRSFDYYAALQYTRIFLKLSSAEDAALSGISLP